MKDQQIIEKLTKELAYKEMENKSLVDQLTRMQELLRETQSELVRLNDR